MHVRSRTVLLCCAVGVLVALRAFVVSPVRVDGSSMAPTLRSGDVVLVAAVQRTPESVERGELVVLAEPGGGRSVKRVVGLPGERVTLRDGVLEVDGSPLDEPYLHPRRLDGVFTALVVVPSDAVYVLGDNRTASLDSRTHGPVSLDRVDGRVLLRLWPAWR